MSKRGYKDHFGSAANAFDRSNKFNKSEKVEDQSLAAQIARADKFIAEEKAKALAAKEKTKAESEKPKFIGGVEPTDEKFFE